MCEENIAAGVANARVHPHVASKAVQSFIPVNYSKNSNKMAGKVSEEKKTKPRQLENFKLQTPTTSKQQVAFFQSNSEWTHAHADNDDDDDDDDSRLSSNFFPQQPRAASVRQKLNFPTAANQSGSSLAL